MSLQSDLAYAHQNDRIRLSHAASQRLLKMWALMDINDLDKNWDYLAPLMTRQLEAAQLEAANQSNIYQSAMNRSYDFAPEAATLVAPAFSGVMGDGREIAPALYGAVTSTKKWIGGGMSPASAFQSGASFLALIAQSAVMDLGRASDVTLATGQGYKTYVRVVSAGACSRCAILAGKYSAKKAFLRHVHCRCTSCPIPDGKDAPAGFHDSPDAYFDSLDKAEQDRVFTNAGAEAIRQGADINQVVNARRGGYGIGYFGRGNVPGVAGNRLQKVTIGVKADGSPLQVFATTEGTTARGRFAKAEASRGAEAVKAGRYRRTTTIRLMPEQIRIMAGGDATRWRELLFKYGYLS